MKSARAAFTVCASLLVLLAACTRQTEQSGQSRPAAASTPGSTEVQKASTVYLNGTIHTVDSANPSAEAIAVRGSDIVYVGDVAGAQDHIGDSTEVVDLDGRFVMPGIISTHEHSIFLMAVSSGLIIEELSHDEDKMLAEVKAYLEENPDGPFMSYGGGYENTVKIHRREIDAITGPDRPFFMMSKTGHAGWANTRALQLAGVSEDEEPIDFFAKDSDGTRNGYVGTAAAAYYMMGVTGLKKEVVLEAAPNILQLIASNGITHMFEAGQPPGYEAPLFDAIGQLEAEGKLTNRYTVSCMVQRQQQIAGAIDCLKKYSASYNSELFKVDTLKIHGDGSFEGHTALLLDPYADAADKFGILSVPEEKSIAAAVEATGLGFNLHTHAIGDAANRSFLRVMRAVREAGHKDARLAMGHTVLVDEADMPQFKELDVIANYYLLEAAQPNPGYLEKLGEARYSNLMRMGSMLDQGVKVALSQDYPSMPINPFLHMHAGVTRSLVGEDEILGSEAEKLTVAEAIRAYTLDAAYMVEAESYSGSLEVGKRADFIVLDRNLLEIPADSIVNTRVLRTVMNGNVVYQVDGT
jgi:predicted amidohydrolase YtcJ